MIKIKTRAAQAATILSMCLFLFRSAHSLDNGLALTPPMGWISWVRFMCETDCDKYPNDCINDKLYREIAQTLVAKGFLEVGYDKVNIDDCWSEKKRDGNSRLVPDEKRFPDGIKDLANFIHSKGLKLGIYGDCGTATCAGYPAQLEKRNSDEGNYFTTDANIFAEWGVDSFKYDGCNVDNTVAEKICPQMSKALNKTGRPILLSCEWPYYIMKETKIVPNWQLASDSCNLWRYYEDIEDNWSSIMTIVDSTIKLQTQIVKHHGPGSWFDPDQLVIGNFGLSENQAKAHMALWCIWSAPLYMSNDLRDIDPVMEKILKNKRMIGVNQDQLGVFGMMVNQTSDNSIQAFVKPVEPIKNGCPSFAILYLNRKTLGDTVEASFELRGLIDAAPIGLAAIRYNKLYSDKSQLGEFSAEACRKRVRYSMRKDLKTIPTGLTESKKPTIAQIEYKVVNYKVIDLIDEDAPFNIGLNSVLTMKVNPSGARMVKIVEE